MYPARLQIDYPERLDRLTTFFRPIVAIPILIVLGLLAGAGGVRTAERTGETIGMEGGIVGGLAVATALMILFRRRYPRWWFDFARETVRLGTLVGASPGLLPDRDPPTSRRPARLTA